MSKFREGDHVRVTYADHFKFDAVGVVDGTYRDGGDIAYYVRLEGDKRRWCFLETSLTLADSEPHAEPDPVNNPSHYTSHPSGVEAITITRHESFLRGNVLKYVLRAPYKGSELQDLRKAAQYLQWEIERAEAAL